MKKTAQSICFLLSAVGILVMSVAVFLFYPASYLALNKGTEALELAAFLMFWLGLLVGAVLQLVSLLLRKKRAPEFKAQLAERTPQGKGGIRRKLARNPVALILLCAFLLGLVGTAASLLYSTNSSAHTFFFMALMVFGLLEYFAFNSLNFAYAISKE